VKPYAATNDHEYFAELTCCYMDKLHYFPFTRDDLKTHDPNGYKLMEAVWGKADKLDAQIKTENAKAADARVQKAKNLLAEKKKDEPPAADKESRRSPAKGLARKKPR
jgi:hypothetical protein